MSLNTETKRIDRFDGGGKVLAGYVMVEIAKKTKNSLLEVDSRQNKDSLVGYVLAVGPYVHTVEVGDRVLMPKFRGATHEVDGKKVVFVDEKDISYAESTK